MIFDMWQCGHWNADFDASLPTANVVRIVCLQTNCITINLGAKFNHELLRNIQRLNNNVELFIILTRIQLVVAQCTAAHRNGLIY